MDEQNNNFGQQPAQPAMPQMNNAGGTAMPVPDAPVQAAGAPEPKDKKGLWFVLLIVVSVALIAAVVVLVILLLPNDGTATIKTEVTPGQEAEIDKKDEEPNKDDEEDTPAKKMAQRNAQRDDDISRFLTAVTDFQTNNSGNTPWQKDDVAIFTRRYIDDKCEAEDGKIVADSCGDEFRDPDGTQYEWGEAISVPSTTPDKGVSVFDGDVPEEPDHIIYVRTSAGCGDKEGYVEYYAGERSVALFYVEEGGYILCIDNH